MILPPGQKHFTMEIVSSLFKQLLYFLQCWKIATVTDHLIAIAGPGPCPVPVQSKSVRESLRISENNKDLDQGIAL